MGKQSLYSSYKARYLYPSTVTDNDSVIYLYIVLQNAEDWEINGKFTSNTIILIQYTIYNKGSQQIYSVSFTICPWKNQGS